MNFQLDDMSASWASDKEIRLKMTLKNIRNTFSKKTKIDRLVFTNQQIAGFTTIVNKLVNLQNTQSFLFCLKYCGIT